MKKAFGLILLIVLGCTTSTSTHQPAATAPAVVPNPDFKNLQVLPKDITRDQLLATMRSFTRGLGVRCNHCHFVTATEPEEKLDFASDAKEQKRVARVMYQMARDINTTWMQRVDVAQGDTAAEGATPGAPLKVSCWTCHRGKTPPETLPPPAPRPAA
jgi:hypothetical protein